jgi:hypothetical protein
MRFTLTAAMALVAAFAFAAVLAMPLSAQEATAPGKAFLDTADRPAGVTEFTAEEEIIAQQCPGVPYRLKAAYPTGLDKGGPLDKAVKSQVDKLLAETKAEAEDFLKEPGICDQLKDSYYNLSVSAYKVSAKAVSVFYSWEQYSGGAHPTHGYLSSVLGPDGQELTASNLFTDPAKSLPLFWERIYRSTCAMGHETAASYYGSPDCAAGTVPPLPEQLTPTSTLDGLGHAVITNLGLTISLDPYDGWSWADGDVTLDIPKADLIKMGADPELWK